MVDDPRTCCRSRPFHIDYLGEGDLAHKVLAIAEEEGAERAAYALKLLQSEGELSIASTGKDTTSGRLVTHEYRVSGPTAIFLTTTAIDVDEELLNRCVVLTVDEDREQTKAIHARQRQARTLEGLLAGTERDAVIKVQQDAQRLLEPFAVVNPFAGRLGFADAATRTRRDHQKYLALIDSIALLHQHQRARHTAVTGDCREVLYIEATVDDIALANRLAHEVLGRSLDELPPQTRRLLELLDKLVEHRVADAAVDRDQVRFSRRDVREWCGWSDFQVSKHLERLVELEYVWAHRHVRGSRFIYELVWDGADRDGPHLCGLVDPGHLDAEGDAAPTRRTGTASPQTAGFEPRSGPVPAPVEPPSSPTGNGQQAAASKRNGAGRSKSTTRGGCNRTGSYSPSNGATR